MSRAQVLGLRGMPAGAVASASLGRGSSSQSSALRMASSFSGAGLGSSLRSGLGLGMASCRGSAGRAPIAAALPKDTPKKDAGAPKEGAKRKWAGKKKRKVTAKPNRYQVAARVERFAGQLEAGRSVGDVLGGCTLPSYAIGNLLKAIGEGPGGTTLALEAFDFLQSQEGVKVDTAHPWTALMMLCGHDGKLDLALQLFEVMQAAQVKPSQITYNVLIAACASQGEALKALAMYEAMKEAGFDGTQQTFVSLLKAVRGDGEKAADVLKWMRKAGVPPGTIAYNAMITACRAGGDRDYEFATEAFSCMRSEGVPRDEGTYVSIIGVLGGADMVIEAQFMYDRACRELGRPASTRVCNALIAAYSKCKRWEDAFDTYESMLADGVAVDIVTFNSLIATCKDSGQWKKAIDVYGWMQRMGIHPDVITLNSLIDTMENGGAEWESMLEVFDSMHAVEVQPDSWSYTLMITAAARDRHLERAVDMFHRMQRAGKVPDAYTYTALIGACEKCGDAERALEVFGWMQEAGVTPTGVTYSSIISACEKGWRWDKAVEIFQEMQGKGINPTTVAYNALLSSYDKSMQWQKALDMFEGKSKVEQVEALATCNALITACERVGLWQRAVEIFNNMKAAGIEGDSTSYGAAISAYEQGGQMTAVLEVFEEMQVAGLDADTVACTALVRACDRKDKWPDVLDMFDRIGAEGGRATISFVSFIEALAEGDKPEMALAVFDAAMSRGAFRMVYDPSGSAEAAASIDLHGLTSVPVATAAFRSWLRYLHRRALKGDAVAGDCTFQIITGWGRHSPSEKPVSLLKTEVRKLLDGGLVLPLEYHVPKENPGVINVSPGDMYSWLQQVEVRAALFER